MRIIKSILLAVFVLVGILYLIVTVRDGVRDHTPPTIHCESDMIEVSVTDGEEALLAGVTAQDREDGDLLDSIHVMSTSKLIGENTARVSYVVFDRAGNMATTSRIVTYRDYRKPRFALTSPLVFDREETVSLENRLTASDVIDGDLSKAIQITVLNISAGHEGVYEIGVQVVNSLGDLSYLSLPVSIIRENRDAPVLALDCGILYLDTGDRFDPRAMIFSVSDPLLGLQPADKADVTVDGTVDTATPGTYTVTYSYTGITGLVTSLPLVVVVQ